MVHEVFAKLDLIAKSLGQFGNKVNLKLLYYPIKSKIVSFINLFELLLKICVDPHCRDYYYLFFWLGGEIFEEHVAFLERPF